MTAWCVYLIMFENWGEYQRYCECLDADLLPPINNVTEAAGSLHPTAFVVHKEHLNIFTHVKALMLLVVVCGQTIKGKIHNLSQVTEWLEVWFSVKLFILFYIFLLFWCEVEVDPYLCLPMFIHLPLWFFLTLLNYWHALLLWYVL